MKKAARSKKVILEILVFAFIISGCAAGQNQKTSTLSVTSQAQESTTEASTSSMSSESTVTETTASSRAADASTSSETTDLSTVSQETAVYGEPGTYMLDHEVHIRKKASTKGEILGTGYEGDVYKVQKVTKKEWGQITYKKQTGYINLSYARVVPEGTKSLPKTVYLTFDDGPSHNTPKILKILKKYDVKATFFVCGASSGETPKYRDYIGKAFRAGHTIAAHSYTHKWDIYASKKAFYEDFNKIQAVIKEQTGQEAEFLRFPGGSGNSVSKKYKKGIMSVLTKDVVDKGYDYVDWNAGSGDASAKKVSKKAIIKQSTASKKKQIILLMHDAASKETTVAALPTIIETYQKRGYIFKAITRDGFIYHGTTIRN